ncbi:uncharacterized protein METZ01_LOCUS63606 [marine metagenome]|uniref:CcmD family protein n=1 Tax=marine metagenome TaxID=408172 RepID=A0A381T3G5_9ZZZZ
MLIGLEYVVAAYGIWVGTFVVYIFLTKRRMKNADQTVTLLEQRVSESRKKSIPTENNENSN